MQAKKRAKPVKFGKKTEEVEKPEKEIIKELPAQEEIESAQEIKQQIAENISSKNGEEVESNEVEQTAQKDEKIENIESSQPEEQPAQNTFGSFSKDFEEPKKKSNWLFFLSVVLITFVIGIAGIAGYYYFSNNTSQGPTPTPTVATVPTSEPSPTEAEIDLAEFSVEVLNGSGISGVAAEVKTQLTDAGFTVDSIGNADATDYTETVIAVKKEVGESFIKKLIDELGKNYLVEEKTEVLANSSEADVVITIGSSKAE